MDEDPIKRSVKVPIPAHKSGAQKPPDRGRRHPRAIVRATSEAKKPMFHGSGAKDRSDRSY